ncbi:MAG: hypothetical protein EOP88_05965 [Verrucomicrobiaceae bacterium]|nr:MAG: hypothetical protein EOP88_05965 [Verrucomicrobiaceae bacterium]
MKTPLAVLLIAVVAIAAFLMGRGNTGSGGKAGDKSGEVNTRTVSSQAAAPLSAGARLKVNARTGPDVMTVEKASKLTPEERIALLKKAAVLADPEKQADILVGLLSAMTQDELLESTRSLLDAQRKGNAWSQEVWNALWTQWGRVNPEACLALSKTGERYPGWNGLNGLNTYNDYRCLMAGWLEARPEDAMAWAKEPKDNLREAMGSAFAITSSADGDLKKMEAGILANAGDDLTRRACFRDYFDLAASSGDKLSAGKVYEQIDLKLRAAAWPEAMERLSNANPEEAASWYEKHRNDKGHDYQLAAGLIMKMSQKDPAATVEWASGLGGVDGGPTGETFYPAMVAFMHWRHQDNVAANAWLQTQSSNTPWIRRMVEEAGKPGPRHEEPELAE